MVQIPSVFLTKIAGFTPQKVTKINKCPENSINLCQLLGKPGLVARSLVKKLKESYCRCSLHWQFFNHNPALEGA